MESVFIDLYIIYITTIKRKRVKKYINLSLSKNTFRQNHFGPQMTVTQTNLQKSKFFEIQIFLWIKNGNIPLFAKTSHFSFILSMQAFPSTSAALMWVPRSQLNYWMSTCSVTTLSRCWWKIASACNFFSLPTQQQKLAGTRTIIWRNKNVAVVLEFALRSMRTLKQKTELFLLDAI